MSWLFPRGTRRLPPVWVDDVPKSVKAEMANNFVKESLNKPLDYTGGFKMDYKELIEKRANDIMESDPLVYHPIWEDEMLKDQIKNTTDEDRERFRKSWDEVVKELTPNPAERKRQLMRLEKEFLVDMVFNLEQRNETLVNNLLEVEKICAKYKKEEE